MRGPRRAANRTAPASRLLAAVAALGLLMVPVQYRAGAELPHPHAIFHLWSDAAHGTLNHHGPGVASVVVEHHHAPALPVAVTTPRVPGVQLLAELAPAAERAAAFVALLVSGFLLSSAGAPRGRPSAGPLVGRNLRPVVLPPRLVVASSI